MASFANDKQYELEHPFRENVAIVVDQKKGRCLVANRDFNPGDILIQEEALCYARYASNIKSKTATELTFPMGKSIQDSFADAYKASNKKILSQLTALSKELIKLPKVAALDTARCLLQLIGLTASPSSPSSSSSSSISHEFQLRMLSQLSAANVKECTRDIKSFRKKFAKWLPKHIKDSEIAFLLGVLNTNQMELDEIGGSGLFVVSAIIEHNCDPNASFTTSGNTVYVAAIKPIKAGDRISLDYTNNFYCATEERIESLRKTYDFICDCEVCSGPDRRRAFDCAVSAWLYLFIASYIYKRCFLYVYASPFTNL